MFRAIGFLIILWGLSVTFHSSLRAIDGAVTATFNAVTTAALTSNVMLETYQR